MQEAKKAFYHSGLNTSIVEEQKQFIEKIIYGLLDKFHITSVEEEKKNSFKKNTPPSFDDR